VTNAAQEIDFERDRHATSLPKIEMPNRAVFLPAPTLRRPVEKNERPGKLSEIR
jgi:hypothetical protein